MKTINEIKECMEFYNDYAFENYVDVDRVMDDLDTLLGDIFNYPGLVFGTGIRDDLTLVLKETNYPAYKKYFESSSGSFSMENYYNQTRKNCSTINVKTFLSIHNMDYEVCILNVALDYSQDPNGIIEITLEHFDGEKKQTLQILNTYYNTNIDVKTKKPECQKFITDAIQRDFKFMDKVQDLLFELSESIYDVMEEE